MHTTARHLASATPGALRRVLTASLHRRVALAAGLALLGCGDDGGAVERDAATDASTVDAIDGGPDAPTGPTFAGTISLLETQVLAPGNTGALFGQGLTATVVFTSSESVPRPLMEEMAGSTLGCKAWLFTPAEATAATVGQDEGPVQVTATAGTSPPTLPRCVFTDGVGYSCPYPETSSTGGTIAIVTAGQTASLTDLDVNFVVTNTTNAFVRITGAARPANNGVFPVVGRPNANAITYANPAAVAETLPATAAHVNLAAAGPSAGVADPGFLADDVALSFVHTGGGAGHFDNFTAATPGTVGADFVLPVAEAAELNALPAGGAGFTIDCGAGCGGAAASIVNLVTTDAPVTGLSPFAMPPPVTRRVQVRCVALTAAVTVPPAYAQLLSGATRIQASFIRPALLNGAPASITAIGGHALVGYTTR